MNKRQIKFVREVIKETFDFLDKMMLKAWEADEEICEGEV